MPTPAYITIQGSKQGNITADAFSEPSVGNVWQDQHKNQILVQEVKHVVTVPTDPQSGQPAGQRVHKPFVFTCALNKAVPLMYNALTSGERLETVETEWWRTSVEGRPEHFFTTKLEDAIIVDLNLTMPHAQNPVNSDYTQLLECSMSYRKITWEHVLASSQGFDDWRAPEDSAA